MIPIFVSYTHDSPDHEAQVDSLVSRLREDARINTWAKVTYDKDHDYAPDDGWDNWCEDQVTGARLILCCATMTYRRAWDGRIEDGSHYGATSETDLIKVRLQESNHTWFIAFFYFHKHERLSIPRRFQGGQKERFHMWSRYDRLVQWIVEHGKIEWPISQRNPRLEIADRKTELKKVQDILLGKSSPKRIALISGNSYDGKSKFMNAAHELAKRILPGRNALINIGIQPLSYADLCSQAAGQMDCCSALEGLAPDKVQSSFSRWLRDQHRQPICLLIDGFQDASPEVKDLIIHDLVEVCLNTRTLILLISTQKPSVSHFQDRMLNGLIHFMPLQPIKDCEDWMQFATNQKHIDEAQHNDLRIAIQFLTTQMSGRPGPIGNILEALLDSPKETLAAIARGIQSGNILSDDERLPLLFRDLHESTDSDPEMLVKTANLIRLLATASSDVPNLDRAFDLTIVPHWFDVDYIQSTLDCDIDLADKVFQSLLELPFVKRLRLPDLNDRVLASFHDAIRLAWRQTLATDRANFNRLTKTAADAFRGREWISSRWSTICRIEEVYHDLSVKRKLSDTTNAERLFLELGRALRGNDCLALAAHFDEIAATSFSSLGVRGLCRELSTWINYAYRESHENLQAALEAISAYDLEEDSHRKARALLIVGDLYLKMGNVDEAHQSYQKSVSILAPLAQNSITEENVENIRNHFLALRRVAGAYAFLGDWERAQNTLQQSLEGLYAILEVYPEESHLQRDLWLTKMKCAEFKLRRPTPADPASGFREVMGAPEAIDAPDLLSECEETFKDCLEWSQQNQNDGDVARSWLRLADVYFMSNRLGEAKNASTNANIIFKKQRKDYRHNTSIQSDFAVTLTKLAAIAENESNPTHARSLLKEALLIVRRLCEGDPKVTHWKEYRTWLENQLTRIPGDEGLLQS